MFGTVAFFDAFSIAAFVTGNVMVIALVSFSFSVSGSWRLSIFVRKVSISVLGRQREGRL